METDRAVTEWLTIRRDHHEFDPQQILETWDLGLPINSSNINQLRKVLQDGIDTLHICHPPRVPVHALHDNDLDTIKAYAESSEVEDDFPCTHKHSKQYLLDPKFTFTKLYQRYKDKIKSANDGLHFVLYHIHVGFNTSTCFFLAFA
jgi:hypothetical protein